MTNSTMWSSIAAATLSILITGAPALAAGPLIYVANLGGDSVSVVDPDAHAAIATIMLEAGSRPHGVALTPDNAKLYVTHENRDYVSVIDTATNTVTKTITVGASPRGVGVTPDGSEVFVANTFGLSVSVIDVGSDTVIATVPLGKPPLGIGVNPNGDRVYTTNSTTNDVSVIDTDTHAVVETIPVSSSPEAVAVSPDGTVAYVTHSVVVPPQLTLIDTSTNTVLGTIPISAIGSRGVALSADGSTIYAGLYAGAGAPGVAVIDADSGTVATSIPLPEFAANRVAFSGHRVYVTHDVSLGSLSVIDAVNNVFVESIPVGAFPHGVVVQSLPSKTALEALEQLLADVVELKLHGGLEASLTAQLRAAIARLSDQIAPNDVAAIGSLRAFVNHLSGIPMLVDVNGEPLPNVERDALIEAAREIIDLIMTP